MDKLLKVGVLTHGTGITIENDGKVDGKCSVGGHIGVVLNEFVRYIISRNIR